MMPANQPRLTWLAKSGSGSDVLQFHASPSVCRTQTRHLEGLFAKTEHLLSEGFTVFVCFLLLFLFVGLLFVCLFLTVY